MFTFINVYPMTAYVYSILYTITHRPVPIHYQCPRRYLITHESYRNNFECGSSLRNMYYLGYYIVQCTTYSYA